MGFWDAFKAPPMGGSVGFGGGSVMVEKMPPKPVEDRETRADILDAICAEHGVTYSIKREPGSVRIFLENAEGDRTSATGATTAEALRFLVAKLEAK